jgi:hypothetical protein
MVSSKMDGSDPHFDAKSIATHNTSWDLEKVDVIHPRSRCRAGGLHGRVVLFRIRDCASVDRDDGYRAELRRLCERADEYRRRHRRYSLSGRVRRGVGDQLAFRAHPSAREELDPAEKERPF